MNVFELIFFLLICAGFGFLGHLVSPRYGWGVGAALAVLVLSFLLLGTFKKTLKGFRRRRNERG